MADEKYKVLPGDLVYPGGFGWSIGEDGGWLLGRFATYGLLVSMEGDQGLVFFPEYIRYAHVGLENLARFIEPASE